MPTRLLYRIDLPRWDQQASVRILPSGKPKSVRRIWDPLQGNSRSHWRSRAHATKEVIEAVAWLAKAQQIPQADHITVTLTWAPGDNRRRDADNLWPLLKVCCDALARGPRADLPGLHLVPDDTPEFMTKLAPVIAPPPAAGLWLDLEVTA